MDLVESAYKLSRQFPKEEMYGLTSQLRRASVSVPANIAEGFYRSTRKDYANFLSTAKGSLMESETLIQLASRPGFLKKENSQEILGLTTEISKMLTALRTRLSSS